MHVIKKKTLQDFWRLHPDAELPLRAWLKDAERADWRTLHDIKAYARSADTVGDNRVGFNIGGNKYRLVVLCLLAKGRLYIRFVGTHAAYDRMDARRI
ncbi:type II toxin-antitoxin system HigB family toxin [Xanthobacter sp. KR7-225]|uniref:type II toxin-antitoxin system HigB family toxin n=1 Tax=Xanthobacter sp. KR7-225 TaxID=3156613 RepID=UPI0032B3A399